MDDFSTLGLRSLEISVTDEGTHRASFEAPKNQANKAHLDRTIKFISTVDPKVTRIIAYAGDKIAILELKGQAWVWHGQPPVWLH